MSRAREPLLTPQAGRLKGERPRRQGPMIAFTLLVLAVLLIGPFLLLRPRESTYILRDWSAATVQAGTLEELVTAPGTVEPSQSIELKAPADSTVDTVLVQEGEDVRAGQALIQLDAEDRRARVEDAQREVSTAQEALRAAQREAEEQSSAAALAVQGATADLTAATQDLTLTRDLVQVGAEARVAQVEAQRKADEAGRALTAARQTLGTAGAAGAAKVAAARGTVTDARTELTRAEQRLAALTVRAPFAGRVVALTAVPGQTLNPGSALITLASLGAFKVTAAVDEANAMKVRVGQLAHITLGDRAWPGRVTRLAAQAVSAQSGSTVAVELSFDTPPRGLRPNATASVDITVAQHRNVPTLPRAEFLASGSERLAYVLGQDGRATRRDVQYGLSDASRVEVLSGLTAGERVLTSSYEAFKDRESVQVSPGGERP